MRRVRTATNVADYRGPIHYRNEQHRLLILRAVLDAFGHRTETFFFRQATVERMHERYLPDAEALDRMLYAGRPVFAAKLDEAIERAKRSEGLLDLADYLGLDSAGCDKMVQQLIGTVERELARHEHQTTPTG